MIWLRTKWQDSGCGAILCQEIDYVVVNGVLYYKLQLSDGARTISNAASNGCIGIIDGRRRSNIIGDQ